MIKSLKIFTGIAAVLLLFACGQKEDGLTDDGSNPVEANGITAYYGGQVDGGNGYYVITMWRGAMTGGQIGGNGKIVRLECFGEVPANADDIPLQTGEYKAASDNSHSRFTWLPGNYDTGGELYGSRVYTYEDGATVSVSALKRGTMTITESAPGKYEIATLMEDEDGAVVKFVYDRYPFTVGNRGLLPQSDIAEDKYNANDFRYAEAYYTGSLPGLPDGCGYWSIFVGNKKFSTGTGEEIQLELVTTDNPNEIPQGQYPMARQADDYARNRAEPASFNGDRWGCWYVNYDNGNPVEQAPAVGAQGSVTIFNSSGTYTISYEMYDGNGRRISGYYTGPVDILTFGGAGSAVPASLR